LKQSQHDHTRNIRSHLVWPTPRWLAVVIVLAALTAIIAVSGRQEDRTTASQPGRISSLALLAFALVGGAWVAVRMLWEGGAIWRGPLRHSDLVLRPDATAEIEVPLLRRGEVLDVWAITRRPRGRALQLRVELVHVETNKPVDADVLLAVPSWLFRNRRRQPEHALLDPGLREQRCFLRMQLAEPRDAACVRIRCVPSPALCKVIRTVRADSFESHYGPPGG